RPELSSEVVPLFLPQALHGLLNPRVTARGPVQQVLPAPQQGLDLGIRRVRALVHLGADQRDQLRPVLLHALQVLLAGPFPALLGCVSAVGTGILLRPCFPPSSSPRSCEGPGRRSPPPPRVNGPRALRAARTVAAGIRFAPAVVRCAAR